MSKLSEFTSSQPEQEEELKKKFNRYKSMDKDQLNSELFKEVARQKSSGKFDYDGLCNMVESLRGTLSEKDYNNIKRILQSLK